jgi:hypothetical protein
MGSLSSCNLENGCDALLKYYNTSILDHPAMNVPELKKACFEEAKVCADTNFARKDKSLKRTVLSELILNHEDPAIEKPCADFIGGPKSLTLQWSSYYKKLIYIFGENHQRYHDCPKIENKKTMLAEDYIYQLYQNGDMFADVYIETGAYFKNKGILTYDYVSRLTEIRKKFITCLSNANSDENCRKGRVHYIDIRHIVGGEDHIKYGKIRQFVNQYVLFNYKDKPEYIDDLNSFFTDIQILKMIEEVVSYSPEEFIQYYLKDEFDANYLFKKELPKSNIEVEIIRFIDENIQKYEIQSLIDDIKLLKTELIDCEDGLGVIFDDDETETEYPSYDFEGLKEEENKSFYTYFRELLNKIHRNLVDLEALVVDAYLLARVFKNFNIDVEDETKQRDTDEPYEPHNIVIYAGNLHSNRYREFLKKKLGFKLIAITGEDWRDKDSTNPYKNCISMEDFPQPFFEYHEDINWLENDSSDKKLPRRSARLNKTLLSEGSTRKKQYPDKNWLKMKSTSGRYYYANPKEGISGVWKRPVNYSSDEDEDMSDKGEEESLQE